MNQDSELPLASLRVDGGMTVNDLLLQLQADLLGITIGMRHNCQPCVRILMSRDLVINTLTSDDLVLTAHAELVSSPGHSQILSQSRVEKSQFLHGCEIKSGSELGTRLQAEWLPGVGLRHSVPPCSM